MASRQFCLRISPKFPQLCELGKLGKHTWVMGIPMEFPPTPTNGCVRIERQISVLFDRENLVLLLNADTPMRQNKTSQNVTQLRAVDILTSIRWSLLLKLWTCTGSLYLICPKWRGTVLVQEMFSSCPYDVFPTWLMRTIPLLHV